MTEGDILVLKKWEYKFHEDKWELEKLRRLRIYPGLRGIIKCINASTSIRGNLITTISFESNVGETHEYEEFIIENFFDVIPKEEYEKRKRRNEIIDTVAPDELKIKIKENIDSYLEFDSDELFKQGDLIRIFGGAIRDSIADQPINDVDILIGSASYDKVHKWILTKGYERQEGSSVDIEGVYKDIHIINEPHTYIKGNKKIQFIRPSGLFDNYHEGYHKLVKEVDLSCCGLSYDGIKITEDYKDAITHCEMKRFVVTYGKMTNINRLSKRVQKMASRGWKENTIEEMKVLVRNHKIEGILE